VCLPGLRTGGATTSPSKLKSLTRYASSRKKLAGPATRPNTPLAVENSVGKLAALRREPRFSAHHVDAATQSRGWEVRSLTFPRASSSASLFAARWEEKVRASPGEHRARSAGNCRFRNGPVRGGRPRGPTEPDWTRTRGQPQRRVWKGEGKGEGARVAVNSVATRW
jgi:hypothetical protein